MGQGHSIHDQTCTFGCAIQGYTHPVMKRSTFWSCMGLLPSHMMEESLWNFQERLAENRLPEQLKTKVCCLDVEAPLGRNDSSV